MVRDASRLEIELQKLRTLRGKARRTRLFQWISRAWRSPSDSMMVAVGFSPRNRVGRSRRVATLESPKISGGGSIVAPRRAHLTEPIRGLKPTATFRVSLREANPATTLSHWNRRGTSSGVYNLQAGGLPHSTCGRSHVLSLFSVRQGSMPARPCSLVPRTAAWKPTAPHTTRDRCRSWPG